MLMKRRLAVPLNAHGSLTFASKQTLDQPCVVRRLTDFSGQRISLGDQGTVTPSTPPKPFSKPRLRDGFLLGVAAS